MTPALAAPIDSASLIAVPAARATRERGAREITAAQDLCDRVLAGTPLLTHIWSGGFGRVGTILIPVVDMSLFDDRAATVAAAVKGVRLAAESGARCVSFTGMIPAATDYARAIAAAVAEAAHGPGEIPPIGLTSGHAAVVAAFAFNVDTILAHAGRAYADENVAFVGVGSIGTGILRLLHRRQRPRRCIIVDIHEQQARLDRLRREMGGGIDVVAIDRHDGLPDWLYDHCSLILSATSTPSVVDVDKMRPGTLMVDDSFPFGFDAARAAARISSVGDIAITIAGGLRGPSPFDLAYRTPAAPDDTEFQILLDRIRDMVNPWPDCMTGCVYSSLVTDRFDLPHTLGPVTFAQARDVYDRLHAAGFTGTPPHVFSAGPDQPEAIHAMPETALARPA